MKSIRAIIMRLRATCPYAECRNGQIWDAGIGPRPCPNCN